MRPLERAPRRYQGCDFRFTPSCITPGEDRAYSHLTKAYENVSKAVKVRTIASAVRSGWLVKMLSKGVTEDA